MNHSGDAEGKEVCLVDDDPSVLKSMHYLLASEGFKIRTFNKAEDFLAHASKNHVPVVVTDIWMDQVTGLELLARLCAISPKTKVIVITAREDGVGIGLPLARQLTERYGRAISCCVAAADGSSEIVVRVRVPVSESESAPTGAAYDWEAQRLLALAVTGRPQQL